MLPSGKSYDDVCKAFRWRIPSRYNIGLDACDRWADGSGRLALIHQRHDGGVARYSFDVLKRLSNQLANVLAAHGVRRGDRVGVLLPQTPETAFAHIAIYKLGAIAVPLFMLFGEDALEYRLADSGARGLITDSAGLAKIAALRERLPELGVVLCTDGPGEQALDLRRALERAGLRPYHRLVERHDEDGRMTRIREHCAQSFQAFREA